MAMTPAEKSAYNKQYYQKYRKKGLKKGRKSGSSAKGRTVGLVGVSASGLNTEGTIEASAIKDRLKKEMNEKLKGAKTDAEKLAIRKEYANKANAEIAKLKADPKFAKAKAPKAPKASSKGSSGGKSSKGSAGSSKSGSSAKASKASTQKITPQTKSLIVAVSGKLVDVKAKLASMNEAERADLKKQLQGILAKLKKLSS